MVQLSLELEDQVFDLGGGDGIESGAGLVEQQHFRIHRQRAGDAQALLLAAGEAVGGLVQLVLDFVPQRGAAQALLHLVVQSRRGSTDAVDARAVGDVVEDRFRERIGPLEDHADAAAHVGHFHA